MEKIAKYADMPDHLRVDLAIRGWLCEWVSGGLRVSFSARLFCRPTFDSAFDTGLLNAMNWHAGREFGGPPPKVLLKRLCRCRHFSHRSHLKEAIWD
jgi:hypothetical protein